MKKSVLQIAASLGRGLIIGMHLGSASLKTWPNHSDRSVFAPNAWLSISNKGDVTFLVGRSEMGQGVSTALPMLIAEELEVDFENILVEFAPADLAYRNPVFAIQVTGASTSISTSWEPLRMAGAAARMMLIKAAAESWKLSEKECRASGGYVLHEASGRKASYADLVEVAAKLPVPHPIVLKQPGEFHLIGTSPKRKDSIPKITGKAVFGIDVSFPGLLTAVIERPPTFGARPGKHYIRDEEGLPEFYQIVPIPAGVAVVSDSFWSAQKVRSRLQIEWKGGASMSTPGIVSLFERRLLSGPAKTVLNRGSAVRVLNHAGRVIEAKYELPYLAHATMEPMNCTADVKERSCTIWAPTQNQTGTRRITADKTGLPEKAVTVHTTFIGCGFGRRQEIDFVAEAVEISKLLKRPIKVIWTREDDMRHDYYRPASIHCIRVCLDSLGFPAAWFHRFVSTSTWRRWVPQYIQIALPPWLPHSVRRFVGRILGIASRALVDPTVTAGANKMPYRIPNTRVEYVNCDPGVPVGPWRSVGHSNNAFVIETMMDVLAAEGKIDPYTFRRRLLNDSARHVTVLDAVVQRSNYGKPIKADTGFGIAVHEYEGTYLALLAEVSCFPDGPVQVNRIFCAVDCGLTVHPGIVEQQVVGGVIFGLSAALFGQVTVKEGKVEQGNFDDYPVLRMDQIPRIDVQIIPSKESPTGVGEAAVPLVAPAVANGLFALTGKPVLSLPLSRHFRVT